MREPTVSVGTTTLPSQAGDWATGRRPLPRRAPQSTVLPRPHIAPQTRPPCRSGLHVRTNVRPRPEGIPKTVLPAQAQHHPRRRWCWDGPPARDLPTALGGRLGRSEDQWAARRQRYADETDPANIRECHTAETRSGRSRTPRRQGSDQQVGDPPGRGRPWPRSLRLVEHQLPRGLGDRTGQ